MDAKDVVDAPYVLEHRENIRRGLANIEVLHGRIPADVIETVDCTGVAASPESATENARARCRRSEERKMLTTSGKVGGAERNAEVRESSRVGTIGGWWTGKKGG